jgi:hypothetical protein
MLIMMQNGLNDFTSTWLEWSIQGDSVEAMDVKEVASTLVTAGIDTATAIAISSRMSEYSTSVCPHLLFSTATLKRR